MSMLDPAAHEAAIAESKARYAGILGWIRAWIDHRYAGCCGCGRNRVVFLVPGHAEFDRPDRIAVESYCEACQWEEMDVLAMVFPPMVRVRRETAELRWLPRVQAEMARRWGPDGWPAERARRAVERRAELAEMGIES